MCDFLKIPNPNYLHTYEKWDAKDINQLLYNWKTFVYQCPQKYYDLYLLLLDPPSYYCPKLKSFVRDEDFKNDSYFMAECIDITISLQIIIAQTGLYQALANGIQKNIKSIVFKAKELLSHSRVKNDDGLEHDLYDMTQLTCTTNRFLQYANTNISNVYKNMYSPSIYTEELLKLHFRPLKPHEYPPTKMSNIKSNKILNKRFYCLIFKYIKNMMKLDYRKLGPRLSTDLLNNIMFPFKIYKSVPIPSVSCHRYWITKYREKFIENFLSRIKQSDCNHILNSTKYAVPPSSNPKAVDMLQNSKDFSPLGHMKNRSSLNIENANISLQSNLITVLSTLEFSNIQNVHKLPWSNIKKKFGGSYTENVLHQEFNRMMSSIPDHNKLQFPDIMKYLNQSYLNNLLGVLETTAITNFETIQLTCDNDENTLQRDSSVSNPTIRNNKSGKATRDSKRNRKKKKKATNYTHECNFDEPVMPIIPKKDLIKYGYLEDKTKQHKKKRHK